MRKTGPCGATTFPNTLNVSFVGLSGSDILAKVPYLAASTGSACHAGVHRLSPVLEAMGVDESIGLGAIRFSLGRSTAASEIDRVVESLEQVISKSESVIGRVATAASTQHRTR